MQAILVCRAFVSHPYIKWLVDSNCIHVVASSALVCSRIQDGGKPVSSFIAEVGVVL